MKRSEKGRRKLPSFLEIKKEQIRGPWESSVSRWFRLSGNAEETALMRAFHIQVTEAGASQKHLDFPVIMVLGSQRIYVIHFFISKAKFKGMPIGRKGGLRRRGRERVCIL